MPENIPITDFPNSSVQIAFVYPDIGADRDIPYVYWNNRQWLQVQYDAFRELWSGEMRIFYGGFEAVTRYFGIDLADYTIEDISSTSPEVLRNLTTLTPETGIIYLKTVVQYCRWFDTESKTDWVAEKSASSLWTIAALNPETSAWDATEPALSDPEFRSLYTANPASVSFLHGLPPESVG